MPDTKRARDRSPKSYAQYCPVARALDVLGERWTLLIVRDLASGPKRYTDLREGLPGIATDLLSARRAPGAAIGLAKRLGEAIERRAAALEAGAAGGERVIEGCFSTAESDERARVGRQRHRRIGRRPRLDRGGPVGHGDGEGQLVD